MNQVNTILARIGRFDRNHPDFIGWVAIVFAVLLIGSWIVTADEGFSLAQMIGAFCWGGVVGLWIAKMIRRRQELA